jgi:Putative Actinobacterial Holin-X, holin superfamily III
MAATTGRSVPELFGDVIGQLSTLLRKEGQLARTEISENISRAALGLGLIVGGAVLLIPALVVLLEAGVAALQESGMSPPAAAGIVGGCALVIGLILAAVGARWLKAKSLLPNKIIQQLQNDAATARRQMRHDNELQRTA